MSKARRTERPRRRPRRRLGRRLFGTVLALGLLVVGGFALAVALTPLPDPNDIAANEATVVYYADGVTEIGRLGEATRRSVSMEQIPTEVRFAVLAAEDRDFYNHSGVSPVGIGRALINNARGEAVQGASTITQQYAKNAYLTSDRSWLRKARELVLSVKLETMTSKDEILRDYLNTIYFGRGAYGVEAASMAYFGTSVSALDYQQAALLGAVIKAPSVLDPAVETKLSRARWAYVLDAMAEQGWITPAQREQAAFPDTIAPRTSNRLGGQVGYLLEAVKADLGLLGYSATEIEAAGLRIVSTFEVAAQSAAVAAVKAVGPTEGTDGLRIGLAAVRPSTGEVIAMYGGPDYVSSPINNATRSFAQAGSTFKPFALAAALEQGVEMTTQYNGDSPVSVQDYTVRNYGDESFGSVDLMTATTRSVNTAYVALEAQIGVDAVADTAYRIGLPMSTPGGTPESLDLTFVLGTASPSGLDMASSYGTFAQRGQRVVPSTITQVLSADGDVQYERSSLPDQVISSAVADGVTSALQQVVLTGTATGAQVVGRPVAGKTGTSNENKSMWFVGYTPQISAAVLMAREDTEGNPVPLDGISGGSPAWGGGSYPVAIWSAFMTAALVNDPVEGFVQPAPVPTVTPTPSVTLDPSADPSADPSISSTATAPADISSPSPQQSSIAPSPEASTDTGAPTPPTPSASMPGPVTTAPREDPDSGIIGDPQ